MNKLFPPISAEATLANQPTTVVIRRRGAHTHTRQEIHSDGSRDVQQHLGVGSGETTTLQHIAGAHRNLVSAINEAGSITSTITLRPDQRVAYEAFAEFLLDHFKAVEATSKTGKTPPFGRYIEPPRTGKTVIMGELIAGTQATTLILVPTQELVQQTRDSLQAQLPFVRIGVYYGQEKRLVNNGVIVATYQIVQTQYEGGTLPDVIRKMTMVFCDEGHKSMSANRVKLLREGFDKATPIVFFTATPDYNEIKSLAIIAPRLIHETTVQEGFERKLFAPVVVDVISVEGDGSRIAVARGDFDKKMLAELMMKNPFLEAVRKARYETGSNKDLPALICCKSRAQARVVHQYLSDHRPPDRPEPKLMLGDTKDREPIRNAFELGAVDTLINVSVLIEGWNSPRCKLLIDLDPGLSEVEAKQKYFRVMTKNGDQVARIVLLLPEILSRIPIFPHVLFGISLFVSGYDDWMTQQTRGVKRRTSERPANDQVREPEARTEEEIRIRTLYRFDSKDILLDPNNKHRVRDTILARFPNIERIPVWSHVFSNAWIETEEFKGFGAHLLRFCGYSPGHQGYWRFIAKFFPGSVASRILLKESRKRKAARSVVFDDAPSSETICSLEEPRGYANHWSPDYDLHATVEAQDNLRKLFYGMREVLTDRHFFVLARRYGLDDGESRTLTEVRLEMGLSKERVRQIERDALTRLRVRVFHLNE